MISKERKSQIYVHRYTMQSHRGMNSRSHTIEHEGALIRVDVNGASGYACIHPWEELGDLSLAKLLKQLAEGRISRQIKCALECADVDREARKAGVSLFESLDVPLSHATIVGGINEVANAVDAGFDTVKLKMGRDVMANISFLRKVYSDFPELMIRLDFNGISGFGALESLLKEVGGKIREKIDFIEDPFPRNDDRWLSLRDRYGFKVGIDRGVADAEGEFDISVVKPAINELVPVCDAAQMAGRSVVITSYMDHPLGQSYAAYCAGSLKEQYLGIIDSRCGLITHGLYEPTKFTERMGKVSPEWQMENGATGLGFDDLLEKVSWKKLD